MSSVIRELQDHLTRLAPVFGNEGRFLSAAATTPAGRGSSRGRRLVPRDWCLPAAQQELLAKRPVLEEERGAARADLQKKHQEVGRLVGLVGSGDSVTEAVAPRLADLQESIRAQEKRLQEGAGGTGFPGDSLRERG